MREKPKCLYWILSTISIISLVALFILIVYLYKFKNDSILLSLYSVWIGIVSGILFGALISLIVQFINDNTSEKDLLNRKKLIRERELNILSQQLSNFLSFYHDNERYLCDNYKIKNSLINGQIDIHIVHSNMKFLFKIYKRANKKNKHLIENYLLISNQITEEYNKLIELLNKKYVEFNNINIDLNYEVFSEEEINSLKLIPLFTHSYNDNFYSLIDDLLKIVKIFDLKIDYESNIWWSILAILLSDDLDLSKLKIK